MLDALGLSRAEQALYELMAAGPPVARHELGDFATAENLADLDGGLRRLESLGLVVRVPEDPPRYAVVPVGPALDALIAVRERSLAAARQRAEQLAARYTERLSADDPLSMVDVVQGTDQIRRRMFELFDSATTMVRGFDAPPYVVPISDPPPLEMEQLERGVVYRVIYDRRALEIPGRRIDDCVEAGEQARVTDLPMKLVLIDDREAFIPVRNDSADLETCLAVRHSTLLDALSAVFEMYWQRAVPLRVGPRTAVPASDAGPAPVERELLPLLVVGLTDREMADRLGWHERTVHRHIHAMMTRLDATTRFQAGYQAVRRGWLTKQDEDDDA